MWKYSPTLTGRVTTWITLFALCLFLMFSFLSLLLIHTAEDTMIHTILRSVNKEGITFDNQVSEISYVELIDMGYEYANIEYLSERVGGFGEFPLNEKYYHFMILENKILLFDSTNFVITELRIKEIINLLLIVLIPFLIASFIISKIISKRALKPFSTLKTMLAIPDKMATDIRDINQNIQETDVKQIAEELVLILEQKEEMLAQQIAFNQGISHELRTPLQVMTHAVELLAIKNPELTQHDVYSRLVNAMNRMHRTSEAMLWLTTTSKSQHQTQVNISLARMKQDILTAYNHQGLKLDIKDSGELSLPMPEEVFEVILYNLVNNAVRHGKVDSVTTPLHIEITTNSLSFKNLIGNTEAEDSYSTTSFGIGLLLVSKFCQRFGLRERIEKNNNHYQIEINLR